MLESNKTKFSRRWAHSLLVAVLIAFCIMLGSAIAGNKNANTGNSIVGFWHVAEIEDAAAPPVKLANFCMGVWKASGDTVNVYHIVFMYNGVDTLPPANYGVLTESNILSGDGNSLNGTFEVVVHDLNNGNQLADIKGTIKANRIDFDHPFTLFSK